MSFTREHDVKAVRKQHRCDTCGKMIDVGARAVRWSGMTDGDFGSAIFHPDCRAAEIELNREAGGDANEWYRLAEEAPRDLTWLWKDYPGVAKRLGVLAALTPDQFRMMREGE